METELGGTNDIWNLRFNAWRIFSTWMLRAVTEQPYRIQESFVVQIFKKQLAPFLKHSEHVESILSDMSSAAVKVDFWLQASGQSHSIIWQDPQTGRSSGFLCRGPRSPEYRPSSNAIMHAVNFYDPDQSQDVAEDRAVEFVCSPLLQCHGREDAWDYATEVSNSMPMDVWVDPSGVDEDDLIIY